MPRIEPIPLDELAPEPRRIIEEGVADGTYATPIPLQIFAYRTSQIMMADMAPAGLREEQRFSAAGSSS